MPLLSIIITYHNEGWQTIEPLIKSIKKQENINWDEIEFIISNNCNRPIDLCLNYYLSVKNVYPEIKNSLAASRQCGLNEASGQYIMFCDCDDELSDPWALQHAFEILHENPNYDIYNFIELITYKEDKTRGYYDPLPSNTQQHRNLVFCHGKIYRKQFIVDNNVQFKTTLKTHEDVNFNLVLNGLGAREFNSDWWLYNWIQWPKSVSHQKNSSYRIQTLLDDIYCWKLSYEEILDKAGTISHLFHDIISDITYGYFICKVEGHNLNIEKQLEKALIDFIMEFDPHYICLEQEVQTIGVEDYKHFITRILYQYGEPHEEDKAWVSLLSDNTYMPGMVALVMSLKETYTMYPIYCIVTPDVREENLTILRCLGVKLIFKDRIVPSGYNQNDLDNWYIATSLGQAGWHNALTKLNIYNLTQFKTIVYIDNDTRVFQNIDDLFNWPHMSAVTDVYGTGESFCSGLLVLHPQEKEYNELIDFFLHFTTEGMIHDQLVLQHFFNKWPEEKEKHIPISYHCWTTYFTGDNLYQDTMYEIKALHYIDAKPWRVGWNYYLQGKNNIPMYVQLSLEYAEYINKCIIKLNKQGLFSKDLFIIK